MDRDRPSFGIGMYDSIDEGIYANMALDVYNNGGLSKGDYPLAECGYTEPLMQTIVLNNVLIYGAMRLLGDNYYALRLPTLLQAAAIFGIVLWYGLTTIEKDPKNRKWAVAGTGLAAVLLLTDFHFLMASVTFESSISRALFLVLIWLVLRRKNGTTFWKYFWTAFLSVISIFFVYLTNVFLVIPGIALIIYAFCKQGKKEGIRALIGYGAGGIVGMIPAELYYIIVWGSGAVQKALQVISDFAGSGDGNYNGNYSFASNLMDFFWSSLRNLMHLFGAQPFFFGAILAVLFFDALIFQGVESVRKNRPEACFILFAVIGYTLQTMAAADFAERKIITIYPLLMLALFEMVCALPEIFSWAEAHRWAAFGVGLLSMVVGAGCYVSGYVLRRFGSAYDVAYNANGYFLWRLVTRTGLAALVLGALVVLILFLRAVVPAGQQKAVKTRNACVSLMAAALAVGVAMNGYMGLKYYYTYDHYNDKATCYAVRDIVGDQYMVGAYGLVFSFYNDAKVVYGDIEGTGRLMDYDEVQYYFDYAHVDNQVYMDYYAPNEVYTWQKIAELPRGLTTSFGLENCAEGIYKKVRKEDVGV